MGWIPGKKLPAHCALSQAEWESWFLAAENDGILLEPLIGCSTGTKPGICLDADTSAAMLTHMNAQELEPASKGKWLALTAALLGWMFDGFEMGLFPLVAGP